MNKRFILILIILCNQNFCFSQIKITGYVKSHKSKSLLNSVNVILKDSLNKSILTYTYTDINGKYLLEVNKKGNYNISFSSLGYMKKVIPIKVIKEKEKNVFLKEEILKLDEIVVQATRPITIKKDTIVFNVKSFLKGNEEVVEDLLKNIPGFNIDSKGTIRVGNQEIEKVMVDGDDFFEKGYKIMTKNLPIHPIEKVEMLKNYSNNKHLKGVENSKKIALNLILKEEARHVWFGNIATGVNTTLNNYTLKGNLASFGKTNKYYFLTNFNNIGVNSTGDIWHLIKSYKPNQPSNIGENEKAYKIINLNTFVPNFKKTRTNFNNEKLLSFNAIFNPIKKLKIKTLFFFNGDKNDFFRKKTEDFQALSQPFINTEIYSLRKDKNVGFGKLDMLYDFSKTKSIHFITKYSNLHEENSSNIIFNDKSTVENLKNKRTLLDQKISYSNKLKKNKVFLFTGRYINEKYPQNYNTNQFFFKELFPNANSDFVNQLSNNEMEFVGLEGHLLDRKQNGNLLEIRLGNKTRKDHLTSSLRFKNNNNLSKTLDDYSNNISYFLNDLYLKTKYLIRYKKTSFIARLDIHQVFNQLTLQNKKERASPFFINPKIAFDWEINNNNKISTSYSYNTTNAKTSEVYPNYILTGSRSFFKGVGMFSQLNSSTFFLDYQLGNWGEKFFANTFFVYIKNHDFFSTNSIIKQNYFQSEKIKIKNQELFNLNTNIDRYFKFISSNLKLNVGFSSSNYKNIVNNSNLREIKSYNYNYGFELRSSFDGIFNYHLGTKWITNKIKSTFNNSFTNNTSFLDLSFIFNDKLSAELQTERYFFGNLDKNNSTYYFADFRAKYILKENKITFSLVGKNLFNTNKFKEFSISDIGSSMTEYRLLPRYLLLKMEYRF